MKFDQWVADLPPQIRRAYETQSWDEIPTKWRDLIRDWTRKMAKESTTEGR